MSLFLIFFFLVYGVMHLYLILKVRAVFSFNPEVWFCIIPWMMVMVSSPYLVWVSERTAPEPLARVIAYTAYTWMGILFLYVSASVPIDVYRLLTTLFSLPSPSRAFALFAPLIIALSITIYGYLEAGDIRVERFVIKTQRLPEGRRLRIVQISDVHLGLIIRHRRLRRILDEVRKAEPDILVSTGDLVDGQMNELEGIDVMFREINPPLGKFAVTGNHEFYAGIRESVDFIERAGFRLLRNEGVTIDDIINIAGVDDPAGIRYDPSSGPSEARLLASLPRDRFTILLKHRPILEEDSTGLFDLQLSGHTHKGQLFPFGLITRLYYPVDAGSMRIMDGSYLYVSRGAGTWGPPMRFLSPPEVTVIDIVSRHNGEKQG